jgi:hypothetical protein
VLHPNGRSHHGIAAREKLQRLITPAREANEAGKVRVFATDLGFDLAKCSALLADIRIMEKFIRNEQVEDAAEVCRMSFEAWTSHGC